MRTEVMSGETVYVLSADELAKLRLHLVQIVEAAKLNEINHNYAHSASQFRFTVRTAVNNISYILGEGDLVRFRSGSV